LLFPEGIGLPKMNHSNIFYTKKIFSEINLINRRFFAKCFYITIL
jgi:hypothetical protein